MLYIIKLYLDINKNAFSPKRIEKKRKLFTPTPNKHLLKIVKFLTYNLIILFVTVIKRHIW